ncbi:MAG TPA: malate dehydrogenase [Williamwhitmania sp.]|nr:malate dehydrogenase [Williamwhitmania sp.]
MKVTVVGAGNVGATCAHEIARKELARELVLVDVKEGLTLGKALDMWQTSSVQGFNTRITGVTTDFSKTANSEVVVITSGIPRRPGMSRDDLIDINARIVKEVTEGIVAYSPNAKIIVVTNPLDVMTYATFLAAKIPSNRVFGMAGILDAARYKAFLAQALNISPQSIHAILMGGHGDSMVPLPRYTTVSGIPITELIDPETLNKIIDRTRKGGGELVELMGTSAWYAPGAAVSQMVEAIVRDQRRVFPVCASLNGEYGLKDLHIGVPVVLGKNGVERIIELNLNEGEMELLHKSALDVKKIMKVLDNLNIFEERYGSDIL